MPAHLTVQKHQAPRKTVTFKVLDTWLLTVYGAADPTDAEWAICAEKFKGMDLSRLRVLIYTMGGAPSPAQRKVMNDVVNGRSFPTALVSSHAFVRGIATAMSWFNPKMKVFTPDDLDDALDYLQIAPHRRPFFVDEIDKLLAEVGR